MTFEFECVIICNMKTSFVPYGNPEDSIMGYNLKKFTSNKTVLLDFVRQVFKNRENEYLSLEEIKKHLENGDCLDLYAYYVFEEKNWQNILTETIKLLYEMGYGIMYNHNKYCYNSQLDRLLNSKHLFSHVCIDDVKREINWYINEEKNISCRSTQNEYYNFLKPCGEIVKKSISRKTHCWSKELYDKIDKTKYFNDIKEIISIMDKNILKLDGEKADTESISWFYGSLDDFLIDKYNYGTIVFTPYAIVDDIVIGGRLTKDIKKAYPLVAISLNCIGHVSKHTYQANNEVRLKIHHLPFSKIENLFVNHYGEAFCKLSMHEKMKKINNDKLWEYNKYHVRYKFLNNHSVGNEIKTKFKLIKETKDKKGYYNAYFMHNNEDEVFTFVQDNQSGLMKFTTDDIQNDYNQWVKNKKRIDN